MSSEDAERSVRRSDASASASTGEHGRSDADPAAALGFDPAEIDARLRAAAAVGGAVRKRCGARYDLGSVPVSKGYYTWDDFREDRFREGGESRSTDEDGELPPLTREDKADALGFDPDRTEAVIEACGSAAADLADLVDERTVNVDSAVDEDAFFSTADGASTLTDRYDLEKAVPMVKKAHSARRSGTG